MTTLQRKVAGALAGGVAGVAVMSLLLLLLEVETRSAIGIFAVIARFVRLPGELAVGFLVFVLAGAVAWPLLFAAVEPAIPVGSDPAARGAAFAVVFWLVFVVTGRGDLGGPLLVVYAAFTLLAHLAYGFTLGAVYARFTGPDRPAGEGDSSETVP